MQITPNRAVQYYDAGTREVNRTGPNGRQVAAKAQFEPIEGESLRDAGSVSGSRTITGPNGRSATVEFTATYGPEGRQASGTVTTPGGRKINFTSEVTRDGDTVQISRSFTGPEGQTKTVDNTYIRPAPAGPPTEA